MEKTDEILASVCVCTFRRPGLLAELLAALSEQVLSDGAFEIVVVDNDARESAAPVIAAARRARSDGPPLHALVEPVQNIARARNRAARAARGRYVAFIDDDEAPDPGWLAALVRAARRLDADGVLGPVLPTLPDRAPAWLVRGGFFDRPRHPTGTLVPLDELRTGNTLIRRALLVDSGSDDRDPSAGPFDPRYGLTGGEDSAFLGTLARAGRRFVWCDEAVVRERVPAARARPGYLLRRSFAEGFSFGRARLDQERLRALPALLVRGAGGIGYAVVVALSSPGRVGAIRGLRFAAAGVGKLAAIAPIRFEAYR